MFLGSSAILFNYMRSWFLLFALLAIWWWGYRHRKAGRPTFFDWHWSLYAAGRLLVDAYRANSPLSATGYHIVQIVALAAVLGRRLSAQPYDDPGRATTQEIAVES